MLHLSYLRRFLHYVKLSRHHETMAGTSLSHVKEGFPTMVDVSQKVATSREAHARVRTEWLSDLCYCDN